MTIKKDSLVVELLQIREGHNPNITIKNENGVSEYELVSTNTDDLGNNITLIVRAKHIPPKVRSKMEISYDCDNMVDASAVGDIIKEVLKSHTRSSITFGPTCTTLKTE